MAIPVVLGLLGGIEGRGLADAAMAVAMLFLLVLLHELAHAWTARLLGYSAREILLHAFGGLLLLDREVERPRDEILISLAGPAINLSLFGLVMLVADPLMSGAAGSSVPRQALVYFSLLNLLLGGFNLLPIFPMDGGRVLRAALSTRLPRLRATTVVVALGFPVAVAASLLAIRYGLYMTPVLFAFMAIAGLAELTQARRNRSSAPTEGS